MSNLYCWGTDSGGFGRLADGSLLANASHYFYTPTQAQGNIKFAKFAQVWRSSLGMPTMCGLTSDGTAYCWGSNAAGQIGDGTTTNRAVPTAVNTPIKFHSLYIFRDPGGTATRASVCGLQRNADGSLEGTAYCWGGNTDSTLGIGSSTNPVMAPTAVAGGLKFAMFAGGASHQGGSGAIRYPLCGLTLAGDAYCWGSGGRERGDGNSASVVSSPGLVLGGRKFSTIGVFPPICGITSAADAAGAGKIFCWGRDGNGNELWGSTPISNISQSNPATITTSVSHNLLVGDLFYIRDAQGMGAVNIGAITYTPAPYSNGTVLFNNNGLTIFSVQAAPPTATTVSPYAFSYAQYLNTTNYSAYTVSGRLIPISRSAPTEIAAGSGISFASFAEVGGAQNIAAVSTAGRVYSLGNNFSGVMGSGDPTTPTNITNGTILAGTTTMVNRAAHGLSAGSIVQLYDFSLQIPNGLYRVGPTTANSFELRTMDGTAVNTSAMGPFTALWYQQVPIGSCWNSAAQGSPAFCYSTPREPVGGFTTSTTGKGVVVNGWGSAMLTTSGIVKAWGANPVGDGTNTARATPVDAAGAVNFRAISQSGGNGGFCGISTASDAYCWGNNNTSGAYGNGGTATALSPTLVSGGFKYSSLISVPYPGGEAQNISCGILDDPALNCASQTVSWVESTRTCSASIPAMVNGEESLLTDSVPANIGNARATCVEGVIRTAAPICVGGPCTADGQPSGGNPASCCNGDSDGNGTCGTQASCTPCVTYQGSELDLYGTFNGGAGCWNYTKADCSTEADAAPCDGTTTTPPAGWSVCP